VNGGPDWVIPAINASASLLGTIVGGLAAYWTSKKTHDRQTAAEEERQKYTLLREAAIRFVTAMTDISVANVGIKEISREWGAVADQLASARTEQDLLDIAKQVDPTIQPGLSRINTLLRLVRLTGLPEEDLKKAITLLTELRFIAPSDVADSAQRVIYTALCTGTDRGDRSAPTASDHRRVQPRNQRFRQPGTPPHALRTLRIQGHRPTNGPRNPQPRRRPLDQGTTGKTAATCPRTP